MKNLLLLSLWLTFLLGGCTDLEEELFDRQTPQDYFQSADAYISTIGIAYRPLQTYTSVGGYFAIQEVASDELALPSRGQEWYENGQWIRIHQHQFDASDYPFRTAWNDFYFGVNACNQVIEKFETYPHAKAVAFIQEAKVLRALYYYFLLDLFGNVPIITQTEVAGPVLTAARAEVFAFVEREILENMDELSKQTGSTYARVNYYVAQALLANLYLNAEVYTGTARWQEAIAACDAIIHSGQYSLTPDYFDNFSAQNEGSPELILAIPYQDPDFWGFDLHLASLHYESQKTYNLGNQPWNGFCSLEEFYNSFEEEDLRKKSFLTGPQYDLQGNLLLDEAADDPDGPGLVFTPALNELWPNCYRQAGARIGKFEIPIGTRRDLSNDMPVFRYADILLMKAEALWRLNAADPEALLLVNQLRQRAGVPPFTELNAENLLAERGRELVFECKRRTDLIRFGVFGESWDFKPPSEPCKTLFPIPLPLLSDEYNQLEQNPCY